MGELWDKFIVGFCKVEFFCWQGDPNWLGLIVIGCGVLIILFTALIIIIWISS